MFPGSWWHHRLDGRESEWTPGDGDGQGDLACCNLWGRKESDTTERLNWTELMTLIHKMRQWLLHITLSDFSSLLSIAPNYLFGNQRLCVCVCVRVCAQSCSILEAPWTVAHPAPLSMEFSRQEYWSGMPFPSPGDLPGIKPVPLASPAWAADSLPLVPPGKSN